MKKLFSHLITCMIVFSLLSCTKTIDAPVITEPAITVPMDNQPMIMSYTTVGYGFIVHVNQASGDSIVNMKIIPSVVDQDTQFILQTTGRNRRKLYVWIVNLTKDLVDGSYYEKNISVYPGSTLEKMTIISGGLYFL